MRLLPSLFRSRLCPTQGEWKAYQTRLSVLMEGEVFCGAPAAYGSGGSRGVQALRRVLRGLGFPQQPAMAPGSTVVVIGDRCFCELTRHEEGMILWNLRTRPDSRRLGLASSCVGLACNLMPSHRTLLAVEPTASHQEQDRLQSLYERLGFVLSSSAPRGFKEDQRDGRMVRWMWRPSSIELALANMVVSAGASAAHQTAATAARDVKPDEGSAYSLDQSQAGVGGDGSAREEMRAVVD